MDFYGEDAVRCLAEAEETTYPKGIANNSSTVGAVKEPYLNHRGAQEYQHAQSTREALEVYQAFMTGYVRRINDATLKVVIGGVRIGSAKYSRLAQINLTTRIITFSRYAIEGVPERGRRYLVIHELAHVKESGHSKQFWELVGRYEPDYKKIGYALDLAFKENVRCRALVSKKAHEWKRLSGQIEVPQLILSTPVSCATGSTQTRLQDCDSDDMLSEEEWGIWCDSSSGILHGGSELDLL